MNPGRHGIQRHARILKHPRAELSMRHGSKIRIHPPRSLPRSMHRFPAINAMNNEIPPLGPTNLPSLRDLLVCQFVSGSLVRVEFPGTEIHKLFVQIFVEAFG